jgi:phage/plasmid-like protein (TIGR03299 family)
VQPAEVLGFFGGLARIGNFQIETVGALKKGRRIWALARVGENANVMDDAVAPYLMLATSYDGTMATIARFTTVRVVCNNTLQAALANEAGKQAVTVPHSVFFKPDAVRFELGISINSWEKFLLTANKMAERKINAFEMDAYLQDLLSELVPYGQVYNADKVRASKGYQRIVSLFKGGQIGSGQDAIDGTLYGLLNACTQYIDYEKGRINDNRLESAWFGQGAKIKERAYTIATEAVA